MDSLEGDDVDAVGSAEKKSCTESPGEHKIDDASPTTQKNDEEEDQPTDILLDDLGGETTDGGGEDSGVAINPTDDDININLETKTAAIDTVSNDFDLLGFGGGPPIQTEQLTTASSVSDNQTTEEEDGTAANNEDAAVVDASNDGNNNTVQQQQQSLAPQTELTEMDNNMNADNPENNTEIDTVNTSDTDANIADSSNTVVQQQIVDLIAAHPVAIDPPQISSEEKIEAEKDGDEGGEISLVPTQSESDTDKGAATNDAVDTNTDNEQQQSLDMFADPVVGEQVEKDDGAETSIINETLQSESETDKDSSENTDVDVVNNSSSNVELTPDVEQQSLDVISDPIISEPPPQILSDEKAPASDGAFGVNGSPDQVPTHSENEIVDSPNEEGNSAVEDQENDTFVQDTSEINIVEPSSSLPPADTTSSHVITTSNIVNAVDEEKNENEASAMDITAADIVNEVVEERTQEEEEWLSMGLGLGDALRQIVALTEERDSALIICQEKDDGKIQAESLLVEVQSRLEAEMNRRAESDSEVRKVRESLKLYEDKLKAYETMEDDLERAQVDLVAVVTEKSKIELEVQKLREARDESEQKEVVLSNRLNNAKKKEATKSTAAGRLEADNEKLREDLQNTKIELETVSKAKAKLESTMEKLKTKAVERVKQAETALAEERELNEERKKKMKVFVETKADELREAKDSANDMQKELVETRASLRSSRDREEAVQNELDAARLKYREIQREIERMKRNSEQLHKMQFNAEQEREKSASETEEHKKKRMSAKHEIMQMVRTLDAERAVSSKLRESMKFTFTPKALSQQELLTEALRDFELELERLAHKTGKQLQPSTDQVNSTQSDSAETTEINGANKKSKRTRSKADMDTERLVSNLEQETQAVSKGIMALSGSIERMRLLLGEDNMFGCVAYFSNTVQALATSAANVSNGVLPGEARHTRLGNSDHEEEERNNSNFV